MTTGDGPLERAASDATDRLGAAGIEVSGKRRLVNGLQLELRRAVSDGPGDAAVARINLYHSARKGLSVIASGGDPRLLSEAVDTLGGPRSDGTAGTLGQDEAGKGDYFGALVVAGFYADDRAAAALPGLGAVDSKTLPDGRIAAIASELITRFERNCCVVSIMPEQYNRRFLEMKSERMNSLDLLAEAHGEVLSRLLERGLAPSRIVIDRFCPMERLRPHLRRGTDPQMIELVVRGESVPAVAAASILARSAYLDSLGFLEAEAGTPLRPGAGTPVDEAAIRLLQTVGRSELGRFVKLHFRNTRKLLGTGSP